MGLYLNRVNLDGVTSATNGEGVNTTRLKDKSILVNVSVNTGAVTVTIQQSKDNNTWYDLDAKTYTATTGKDVFSFAEHFPYMRTITTSQTNSTVTTTITGAQ